MTRIVCSLMLMALFTACQKTDKNPLRHSAYFGKVYAHVLYATRGATPASTEAQTDSAWRYARIDSVLAAQQLSRTQLTDAVQFFSADPERWQQVYQIAVNELDSLSIHTNYVPKPPLSKN